MVVACLPEGFVDGVVVSVLRELGDQPVGRQQSDRAEDRRADGVDGEQPIELLPRRHETQKKKKRKGREERACCVASPPDRSGSQFEPDAYGTSVKEVDCNWGDAGAEI